MTEKFEEAAFGAWVGPSREGASVGSGKVDGCASDGDAMLGVLEGASKGDDEVRDGADRKVAVVETAKGGWVMGERKGMWWELCGVASEATNEVV